MRSSELAALAGVTVRTLRHYHQMGLLDEPGRMVNGYRRYDVRHLVRLLRIVRLTGLGIPLAALPEVLDDPAAADAMLDELDRQAAAEIERLTARRETIARVRRDGATPDTPPWLAARAALFAAAESAAPELARYERDQLILLGHLAGSPATEVFGEFYRRLDEAGASDTELYRRFHVLGPDSSEDEVRGVAGDFAEIYGPLLRELTDRSGFEPAPHVTALMAEFAGRSLTEQQLRAVALLAEHLGVTSPR